MKAELSESLKEKINLEEADLKFWKYHGAPYNPANEGFLCIEHKVSLSFPIKK